MNQRERLDLLVDAFLQDSAYRDIHPGKNGKQQRDLLRSLMNVRLPKETDPETLRIQDEYLQERSRERGIVDVSVLPTVREEGSAMKHGDRICLWQGDITRCRADAIVNAANEEMLGCFIPMHTCIDNCIHTYAGVQLRQECDRQMRGYRKIYGKTYVQPTAVPMLTGGYNLPAKHVIHIVGPIVRDRVGERERNQLKQCYINVLDLCRENGLKNVVFCCISTGVFRFPSEEAAGIAVETVSSWLDRDPDAMERVVFNVFKDEDREIYRKRLF